MSRGSITREYVAAVADGIRYANGTENTYTPAQMGNAVRALKKTLVAKTVNANGEYNPASDNADGYSALTVAVPNSYAAADEGKVVQNGALVAQTSRTVTENGTVDTTTNNQVVVNVSGGVDIVPLSVIQNGTYTAPTGKAYNPVTVNVSGGGGLTVSLMEAKYINDYSANGIENVSVLADGSLSIESAKSEYSNYIYGRTDVISDLGLVLLGNFSSGGAATDNALSDSISNFSGLILQGIYSRQPQSGYNTTMLYHAPVLDTPYWAGMKDRNSNYTCNVTFTANNVVSLSGNRQVIIYGIP